ncbi:MAG: OmpA family protein [Pseudomonadota bacterium]
MSFSLSWMGCSALAQGVSEPGTSVMCERPGAVRSLEIVVPGAGRRACEVRGSRGPGSDDAPVVYWSRYDASFCYRQAAEFVRLSSSEGWSCTPEAEALTPELEPFDVEHHLAVIDCDRFEYKPNRRKPGAVISGSGHVLVSNDWVGGVEAVALGCQAALKRGVRAPNLGLDWTWPDRGSPGLSVLRMQEGAPSPGPRMAAAREVTLGAEVVVHTVDTDELARALAGEIASSPSGEGFTVLIEESGALVRKGAPVVLAETGALAGVLTEEGEQPGGVYRAVMVGAVEQRWQGDLLEASDEEREAAEEALVAEEEEEARRAEEARLEAERAAAEEEARREEEARAAAEEERALAEEEARRAEEENRTEAIKQIQTALTQLLMYDRGVDGRAGPGTLAGIQRFGQVVGAETPNSLDEMATRDLLLLASTITETADDPQKYQLAMERYGEILLTEINRSNGRGLSADRVGASRWGDFVVDFDEASYRIPIDRWRNDVVRNIAPVRPVWGITVDVSSWNPNLCAILTSECWQQYFIFRVMALLRGIEIKNKLESSGFDPSLIKFVNTDFWEQGASVAVEAVKLSDVEWVLGGFSTVRTVYSDEWFLNAIDYQAELEGPVGHRVYFSFGDYLLEPGAQATLRRQADFLLNYPELDVLLVGADDEIDTDYWSTSLSFGRAEAARTFLVSLGIDPERIYIASKGKEEPLDPSSDPVAWAMNRNVTTFVFLRPE